MTSLPVSFTSDWKASFLTEWSLCLQENEEIQTVTDLSGSIGKNVASELRSAKTASDLDPVKELFKKAISQSAEENSSPINQASLEGAKHLMEGAMLVIDGYFHKGDSAKGTALDRIQAIDDKISANQLEEAKKDFIMLASAVFKNKIELSRFFVYGLQQNLEFKTRQWGCALSMIHEHLTF